MHSFYANMPPIEEEMHRHSPAGGKGGGCILVALCTAFNRSNNEQVKLGKY